MWTPKFCSYKMDHQKPVDQITFMRHTFRGILPSPINDGVSTLNINGVIRNIPRELTQQYLDDEIRCGLTERVRKYAGQITDIIADLGSRRVYATAQSVATAADLDGILGVPIKSPVKDNVVVGPIIPYNLRAQAELLAQLKDEAYSILTALLHNLQLPEDIESHILSNPILGLPDFVIGLPSLVVMICGFPDRTPTEILVNAGWDQPRYPDRLLNQGTDLIGIFFLIESAGNFSQKAAAPAAYILQRLGEYHTSIDQTAMVVTHDDKMIQIFAGLGLLKISGRRWYPVMPLQQLVFQRNHNDNTLIDVFTVKSHIKQDGRASVHSLDRIFEGHVPIMVLQQVAQLAPPEPTRILIPIINDN